MNVLVIGNGAREHAIIYKLAQSSLCEKIYCAKGNAGTLKLATNVDISPLDFEAIVEFCKQNSIEFVVVGPEEPLANGIVDYLNDFGISAFGPTKKAAMLESSKSFCKNLCKKYAIPTAAYEVFDNFDKAFEYIKDAKYPLVIKADGLAAGKGVVIAHEGKEALMHLQDCFNNKKFGQAGNRVVIEEFLEGEELSYMVFCDGENFVPMLASQDHKRVFDGDLGPNTGGMGAYAKAPIVNEIEDDCKRIIKQTIYALESEGIDYRGVLYAGLMVVDKKPYVLEYNCRFGDPETQVVLPLLKSDLLDIMIKCTNSNLNDYKIAFENRFAVSVVLASKGYPVSSEKDKPIFGLDDVGDALVFHAGTYKKDGKIFTNGGRVLNIVALDADFRKAIKKAYEAVGKVNFDGMHFRRDIGKKALKYL
ncbi:Phosphoribosylamine--glycine ligase [Desulfurella amilsii]|uniref:Phosphoribosylamine--glycine ligase n=1 Tax=Desulfurella amilsii TaxID=1562698 RepID=A0A1X4XXG3_9BACT|nr:phosphoribosylamine--glycine ligase [Desulfurella amilsii]OSS42227.1 Phosphoribosylamine--glycine ligase [Desulfurella amilsii]